MTTSIVAASGQSNILRLFDDPEALFAFQNLTGAEVINTAIGGTPITDVKPRYWTDFRTEDAPYDLMLEEIDGREVDVIIFGAGEGDARLGALAIEVFFALVKLERHWDRDLGPDIPILVLPVMADLPGADAVNRGLRLYARYSDDAQLVQLDPVTFEDGLHYDAVSRIAIAEALARAVVGLDL